MICREILSENCLKTCKELGKCTISADNRKNIVCEEKKKRYSLINDIETKVYNYHLDANIIKDSDEQRCDYLIYIDQKQIIILVELKGTGFHDAVKQIYNTIKMYNSNFSGYKVYGRIISQGVPNIQNDPDTLKLVKQLKEKKGSLLSHTKQLSEYVSRL